MYCKSCPKYRNCDDTCPIVDAYADQDYVPQAESTYSLSDYVRAITRPYELSRRDQENLIRRVGTHNHLHQFDTEPDDEGNYAYSHGVWENSPTCHLDREIIRMYYFKRMLQKQIADDLCCSPRYVSDIIGKNHYLVVRFRRENRMPRWKPNKYAQVGKESTKYGKVGSKS